MGGKTTHSENLQLSLCPITTMYGQLLLLHLFTWPLMLTAPLLSTPDELQLPSTWKKKTNKKHTHTQTHTIHSTLPKSLEDNEERNIEKEKRTRKTATVAILLTCCTAHRIVCKWGLNKLIQWSHKVHIHGGHGLKLLCHNDTAAVPTVTAAAPS